MLRRALNSPEDGAAPGLDEGAVAERVRRGQVNVQPPGTGRTVSGIVRANVFTRFNALLGGLLVVILAIGAYRDALFGIVLVANTLIGIVQELRAKWTLDRLSVLASPTARVWRSGQLKALPLGAIVIDDVLEVGAGDQIPVDCEVLLSDGLELDESLLTGEADPVHKDAGAEALSGSFVVAGRARLRATRVGGGAYANRLAAEARRFEQARSELRTGIDRVLRFVTWLIVPTGVLLVANQLRTNPSHIDALRGSVAGLVAMVPEGLVLLTSLALAVGVVRLARRRALVQELAAVELLARVDVVCLDKTGTLTEGGLELVAVEPLTGDEQVTAALGALATLEDDPGPTLGPVATAIPDPGWRPVATVPFSSARKWSAATFDEHGTWVLGAPDVLLRSPDDPVRRRVDELAAAGRRVLLVARSRSLAAGGGPPAGLAPAALVVLGERVRPDAAAMVRYFHEQGVAVKVISGDHPRTTAAVAARVGVPGATDPLDARDLPDDPARLAAVTERHAVFGRVTPHQKRAMVAALQARGHVVAMTGDGVNDVLALKDADIGVAMGAGSSASRGVAKVVLLDDSFAALPAVVAEGRRVIANVERVANLFLTKTVYAFLLAVAVGVAARPFPFFPRHLTVVSSLTIGVPAFFLALAPNANRARSGFLGRVLRFAVPAGAVAAAATYGAYALVAGWRGATLSQARTASVIALFVVAMWVLGILARPVSGPRSALVATMVLAFIGVLAYAPARAFFELHPPGGLATLATLAVAAAGIALLEAGWQAAGWVRRRHPAE